MTVGLEQPKIVFRKNKNWKKKINFVFLENKKLKIRSDIKSALSFIIHKFSNDTVLIFRVRPFLLD